MLCGSCGSEEQHDQIKVAYAAFTNAAKTNDAGRLYDMSPKAFRDRVDKFYLELSTLIETVEREYPKAEVEVTVENLAKPQVSGAANGRDLVIALVDFSGVTKSEDVDDGLAIDEIGVSGTEATLTTRAGEVFNFIQENNAWHCNSLAVQFDRAISVTKLRANIKAVNKNLAAWKKATRETTDQTRPEGVFNVLTRAVKRAARVKIYELLAPNTQGHLKHAAELARNFQKVVDRKYPRKRARLDFLKQVKLGWITGVAGDKSLFAAMFDAGLFRDELPLLKAVTIREIRVLKDDTAILVAATSGGDKKFEFQRLPTASWRLLSLEPVIVREAVRRLEVQLKKFGVTISAPALKVP